jgi:hypothetical protein
MKRADFSVSGLGQTVTHMKHQVSIQIQSRCNQFKVDLSCPVIPEITGVIPSVSFDGTKLKIPKNLILADPSFLTPDKVDILIGADTFWNLITIGQIKLERNLPILQKTQLGWVVLRPLPLQSNANSSISCHFAQTQDLHVSLKKFWEVEEVQCTKPAYSQEETACETHFTENTRQLEDERFVVKIPLKKDPGLLGKSKQSATRRFYALERKLQSDPDVHKQYCDFMSEYERLGHMTKFHDDTSPHKVRCFIPHHAVLRPDKSTTKLRVVFGASAKSSSNYSFKDLQMVGPTVQDELVEIVLRFRKHKIALSADVTKMYRQVLVDEGHRPLQSIVWRENPSQSLQTFELNTVTYGTASAPFLAIRSLHQITHNNMQAYPEASLIIISDFYVDDLLTGADSIEKAKRLHHEISTILGSGCFPLRKWISNEPSVLKDIRVVAPSDVLQIGPHEKTKTLGIHTKTHLHFLSASISRIGNVQNALSFHALLRSLTRRFFVASHHSSKDFNSADVANSVGLGRVSTISHSHSVVPILQVVTIHRKSNFIGFRIQSKGLMGHVYTYDPQMKGGNFSYDYFAPSQRWPQ